jgi:putative intracellular protease/amidase
VDSDSIGLIGEFLQQGKPVAAVCHAPAVLVNVKSEQGEPVVQGKRVSGFSNSEEAAVGLTHVVPFLLEDRLQALGASYSAVDDWHPYAVVDGQLITGQNPASSEPVADALLDALRQGRA